MTTRTPYHTYMEAVFALADSYVNGDATYTDAEITSRELGGEYGRPWMSVLHDFEVACDEIKEEEAR